MLSIVKFLCLEHYLIKPNYIKRDFALYYLQTDTFLMQYLARCQQSKEH